MVPMDVLLGNLAALVLVWGWTIAAGILPALLCKRPFGLGGSVLFGLAFWAATLYLLPFRGGLVAVMVAVALGVAWAVRVVPARVASCVRVGRAPAAVVLLIGAAAFASLLVTHHVPPGMDASMHASAGRLIGEYGGLPPDHAPFARDLRLPALNLGLPTLAAVAVRCGASVPAAFLAAEQLVFAALILAVYLLLRLWVRATPAALLAVFAVWTSRGVQETIGWGGVPTVASVAAGVFAARLLLDSARGVRWHAGVPLGLVVASLPLLHGVGAAVWGYAVAPVALCVALARAHRFGRTLPMLATAGAVAALLLGAYLVSVRPQTSPENLDWTRRWQADYAPAGDGWRLIPSTAHYLVASAGNAGVWPGLAAFGLLLAARRFRPAAALAATMLLLGLVAVNARSWTLPFSFLLYPERTVYWMTPLAACAVALAWRELPPRLRSVRVLWGGVTVVMIGLAGLRHATHFHGIRLVGLPHQPTWQRAPDKPEMGADDWEVLRWAGRHLDPESVLVQADYQTAGSYLPAVAGLATNGWHMHHFNHADLDAFLRRRPVTHALVARQPGDAHPSNGRIVYENRKWRLVEFHRDGGAPPPASSRR